MKFFKTNEWNAPDSTAPLKWINLSKVLFVTKDKDWIIFHFDTSNGAFKVQPNNIEEFIKKLERKLK